MAPGFWAAGLGIALAAAAPAMADEVPKYGGILTYMIPADLPPSFDAQREETYATIHSAAPFYSVLIRIDPNNPGSTTDIVCDLCTEMPQPTDGGKRARGCCNVLGSKSPDVAQHHLGFATREVYSLSRPDQLQRDADKSGVFAKTASQKPTAHPAVDTLPYRARRRAPPLQC